MTSQAAPVAAASHADRVRAFYDAWNRRDWDAVANGLDAGVEWFHATRRELVRGKEAVVALLRSSADAFPDARIHVRGLHVNGDFVIAEWSVELATARRGKRGSVVSEVQVFSGEKCVRGTSYGDVITMLLDGEADVAPELERIVVDMPKTLPLPRALETTTSMSILRSPLVARAS